MLIIVINNRILPVFMVVNNSKKTYITISFWKSDFGVWGGITKLLFKIVINNCFLPVFMVVNNSEKIDDYVRALINWFWCMGGLAKLLLVIVINNRVLRYFMVANNLKKIVANVSPLENWFWRMRGLRIYCIKLLWIIVFHHFLWLLIIVKKSKITLALGKIDFG